jgi:hypothetical protein
VTIELVVSSASFDVVIPGTSPDPVRSPIADQCVGSFTTDEILDSEEPVVSCPGRLAGRQIRSYLLERRPASLIDPRTAVEVVVKLPLSIVENVAARTASKDVLGAAAVEIIVASPAKEPVFARPPVDAINDLIAATPPKPIVSTRAIDEVVSWAAVCSVRIRPEDKLVGTGPAANEISALETPDDVMSGSGNNHIAAGGSDDAVRSARADDRGFVAEALRGGLRRRGSCEGGYNSASGEKTQQAS